MLFLWIFKEKISGVVALYPNPAGEIAISLYDVSGKVILINGNESYWVILFFDSVPNELQSSGIYVLEVLGAQPQVYRLIVK